MVKSFKFNKHFSFIITVLFLFAVLPFSCSTVNADHGHSELEENASVAHIEHVEHSAAIDCCSTDAHEDMHNLTSTSPNKRLLSSPFAITATSFFSSDIRLASISPPVLKSKFYYTEADTLIQLRC